MKKNLTIVIPRELTILKQMTVASQDKNEIQKMIELQLINEIPHALNEIIFDYHIIETQESGHTKILCVIVHQDIAQRYVKILQDADLPFKMMTLSSFGLLRWYQKYLDQTYNKKRDRSIALINLDFKHSEICFIKDSSLLMSRPINVGYKTIQSEGLDALMKQIELSLHMYQDEMLGEDLKRIILLSSLEDSLPLREQMSRLTKIPIIIERPHSLVDHYVHSSADAFAEETATTSVAPLLGLSYPEGKHHLLLTPPKIKERHKQKFLMRQWAMFAALTMLVCALYSTHLIIQKQYNSMNLKALITKIKSIDSEFKEAKARMSTIKAIEKKEGVKIFHLDLVASLNEITSDQVSFRNIHFNNRNLTIEGYAKSVADLNEFQNSLVKSPLFEDVDLKHSKRVNIFKKTLTDFKLMTTIAL